MISLDFGIQRMLAEIGAAGVTMFLPLADPGDDRFSRHDRVVLVVSGETPQVLVPSLHEALRRRFAEVDPQVLEEDLLSPLKKAIGNAERRGNRGVPGRRITVRVTTTREGAVVAVHDEGDGFDYASVYAKFRGPGDEKYFTRKGQGFEKFEKTNSRVSWADGGRTFLLRFLAETPPGREPAPEAVAADPALDAEAMRPRLAAALGVAAFESCRVFVPDDRKNEAWDVKYRIVQAHGGAPATTRILTGRRLELDLARRDAERARSLAVAGGRAGAARVPAPAGLVADPAMVLYDFDPQIDLRDAFKQEPPAAERDATLAAIGRGLAAVHASGLALPDAEPMAALAARLDALADRAATIADGHPGDHAPRIRAFGAALGARIRGVADAPVVPAHGDFGWHRVLRGGEGLYLVGFEHARRAHPGLDVGGFLADVERHGAREEEDEPPRDVTAWRAAFLDAYSEGRAPAWFADLPGFTAAGLLTRLDRLLRRPPKRWLPKIDALLALGERSLDRG